MIASRLRIRPIYPSIISRARAFIPLHALCTTVTEKQPNPSPDGSTKLKAKPTASTPTGQVREASPRAVTTAEADEELMRKLEEISGDGGASGIETEDGKPASMKRAVKNNMFRYI